MQSVADVASHPLMCPSQDAVCHRCAKCGHFQSVCRSTAKVGKVHLNSPHVGEAFLGTLTKQGDNPNSSPWAVTVSLNRKPTQFKIDTGAELSVILYKAHREIGSPKLYHLQRIL